MPRRWAATQRGRCLRPVGALTLLVPLLAGCFTGPRPSLESQDQQSASTSPIGDANVDAVLTRLDRVADATFTAHLHVLTRYGNVETDVVVSQDGLDRQSVTIGNVRYLRDHGAASTCDLAAGTCTSGIDESRVSNLQLTSQFYGIGAAARLRQDARVRVSSSEPSTSEIAGQRATCVLVPVTGGNKVYCALDNGVLASVNDATFAVTLTDYSPTVDEALFTGA
jgi:hypothetical protein